MKNNNYPSGSNARRTGSRPKISKSQRFVRALIKYIIPFLIFNGIIFYLVTSRPHFDIKVGESKDYLSTEIEVRVKSLLPVRNVTAALDSEAVELTKKDGKHYTALLKKNGVLEIYMENVNGMASTVFEQINILDDTPPAIVSSQLDDGVLTLYLDDSQAGIDYTSIYATTEEGETLSPISTDKLNGKIEFEMESDSIVVFITDLSGNQSQTTVHTSSESDGGVQTEDMESDTDSE